MSLGFARISKRGLVLAVLATAWLVDGCYDLRTEDCGGIVCAPGWHCTADGDSCTQSSCGNGIREPELNEQCDDGNTKDGDECSSNCRAESCGDGIQDPQEDCDGGDPRNPGAIDTAECDADCTVRECGDGHTSEARSPDGQPIEDCDDGNTNDGDKCSAQCREESCGNGVLDEGEECDGGDPGKPGAKDTPECDKDCTPRVCGDDYASAARDDDGRLLEICDNGDRNSDELYGVPDGCTTRCEQAPSCGDGNIDEAHGETCDPEEQASTTEPHDTAGCNFSPEARARGLACKDAACGDGYTNEAAQEECDESEETKDCTAECKSSSCGDGYTNPAAGEECDDRVETFNCTGHCTSSSCGDGYINLAFEECDRGPDNQDVQYNDEQGCIKDTCQKQPYCGDGNIDKTFGEACDKGIEDQPCNDTCQSDLNCGNGFEDLNEECDGGDPNTGPLDTAECTRTCKNSKCGDGYVNAAAGEACDYLLEGCKVCGCDGPGQCPSQCGTCDPRAKGVALCDVLYCTIPTCGDRRTNHDAGEDCDNGPDPNGAKNTTPESTDCNSNCTESECGDSVPNKTDGEDCDEGGNTRRCDSDCTRWVCGDGHVNPSREECDEGGATPTCTADCKKVVCGDQRVEGNEECDEGAESADCDDDCTRVECGDFNVNEHAGETCDAGSADTEECNGAGAPAGKRCKVARCMDGYENEERNEDCDPGRETADCDTDCTPRVCGDLTLNRTAGETCDVGEDDTADCNGSNAPEGKRCKTARCHDEYKNEAAGEQCDEKVETDKCDADCTEPSCGDGYVNRIKGEQCDDEGESEACNSNCTIAHCGDKLINAKAGEECDRGGASPNCDIDCTARECGDDLTNRVAGERCDDGKDNQDYGGNCKTDCSGSSPRCGDGATNGPEECDDGRATSSCTSACKRVVSTGSGGRGGTGGTSGGPGGAGGDSGEGGND